MSPTGFGRKEDGSIYERSEEPSSQKQQHHLLLSPDLPRSQASEDNVKITTLAEKKPSNIAWNPAHGGPGQLTLQASSLCAEFPSAIQLSRGSWHSSELANIILN